MRRERSGQLLRTFSPTLTQYLESTTAYITAAPLSLACWFWSDSLTLEQSLITLSSSGNTTASFRLSIRGPTGGDPVTMSTGSTSALSNANSATGYTLRRWHHAIGISASATSRFAGIDGVLGVEQTTSRIPTGLDRTTIGRLTQITPSNYMSGRIAHAAIWQAALRTHEIAALAAGVLPLFVRPDALVAYWPLTDGAPMLALDAGPTRQAILSADVGLAPTLLPMDDLVGKLILPRRIRLFRPYQQQQPGGTTLTPPAVRAVYRASTPVVTTGNLRLPAVRAEYRASTAVVTRSFTAVAVRAEYRASTPVVATGVLQMPAVRAEYRVSTPQLTRSLTATVARAEYRSSAPTVTLGVLQLPAVRAEYRISTPAISSGNIRLPAVRAEYRVSTPVVTQGDTVRADTVRAVYAASTPFVTRTLVNSAVRAVYTVNIPIVATGVIPLPSVRAEYRAPAPLVTRSFAAVAVRAEYRASTPTTEGGGGTTLTPPAVRAEYRASAPQLTRSLTATVVRGTYRVSTPVLSMVAIPHSSRAEYRVSTPAVTRILQPQTVRTEYRVVVPALTMTVVAVPSRAEYRVSAPIVARVLVAQPAMGQYAVSAPLTGRTVLVTATHGQYATRAASVTGGGQLSIDAVATGGKYAVQTPIAALAVPPFTRMASSVFLQIRQRADEVILTYE